MCQIPPTITSEAHSCASNCTRSQLSTQNPTLGRLWGDISAGEDPNEASYGNWTLGCGKHLLSLKCIIFGAIYNITYWAWILFCSPRLHLCAEKYNKTCSTNVFNIDNNKTCFLSSKSAYYYDFWWIMWHWRRLVSLCPKPSFAS